jgi:hypothetical protein
MRACGAVPIRASSPPGSHGRCNADGAQRNSGILGFRLRLVQARCYFPAIASGSGRSPSVPGAVSHRT